MKKATHIGTCQCCGATQKLPKGVLSLHGYNVSQWGFFNGICRGAGYLPYEQSFDLIQKFIDSAKAEVLRLQEMVSSLTPRATTPIGWYHEYVSGNYRTRGHYTWNLVELHQETKTPVNDPTYTYNEYSYTDYEKKKQRLSGYFDRDVLDIATRFNHTYIEQALKPHIEKLERYIAWQQDRIDTWKLTELLPVPPPPAPDPNRRLRRSFRRSWSKGA